MGAVSRMIIRPREKANAQDITREERSAHDIMREERSGEDSEEQRKGARGLVVPFM